ncbi:MAG: FtsX-like permease family protein [Pseudomonadota bacterium]|nr:FtsX-like permease family protein [Pseudomonadota bacterium]
MNGLAALGVLMRMALRNLVVHRVKSGVVGLIMFFGTFLVVSGTAMLDSIRGSMEKSITSSLSGNIQVYSSEAEDPLALFGGMGMSTPDIGEIDEYKPLREALLEIEGVKSVTPMGIATATVFGGTEIDRVLGDLRVATQTGDADGTGMRLLQLVQIAGRMRKDVAMAAASTSEPEKVQANLDSLDRVLAPGFADELAADPSGTLDWLDNKVAPIAADGRMLYLRTIGTNLDTFPQSFDRFRLVDGELVPPGQRGILLSKAFYEKQAKNFVARELDKVKKALDQGKTIATDAVTSELVARTATQYQRIQFQLSPNDARVVGDRLRTKLGSTEPDLAVLLQSFLKMDDTNFTDRYTWFYQEIAPRVRLYEVPVGEQVTLRSFTKSGYIRAVNVKVYGTFEFSGLETSDLAGANNLVDMLTFRSLYGKMTDDQLNELADIKAASGVKAVTRDNAEDALFGGGSTIEAETTTTGAGFDEFAGVTLGAGATAATPDSTTYTTAQMEDGLALTAAVILDNPGDVPAMIEKIEASARQKGLSVQAVDWQTASGIVGQLVMVLQVVLYTAIFIIFLVALVIINNTMVMATMERTTEIGTMRAIGAQRPFVILLFLVETMLLGAIAGGLGAGTGALFITWLNHVGVPAVADALVLLFAGPRLYPVFTASNIAFGMGSILAISALSTLYPSVLAARVPPVVAMQAKD